MIEPLMYPYPEGEAAAEEMEAAARRAGYTTGVQVLVDDTPEVEGYAGAVVTGSSVGPMKRRVERLSGDTDLLYVETGGSPGPFASDDRVDGLVGLAGSRFLDRHLLRAAKRSGVALVFDLSRVFGGGDRFRTLKRMNRNAETCRDTGCGAMVTAAPRSVYGVRAHRELKQLALLSGFEEQQAEEALDLPRELVGSG